MFIGHLFFFFIQEYAYTILKHTHDLLRLYDYT